ncbi:AraC family transcriptional regulator [Dietzia sp. ANT_WB102]|uniref:helix-turn-helix domain-containing protein n=1 Tax=Dietzia sp. ANT_WB102 TaxID=2597345 RepID=UPI0011EEF7C5|nr:helix-turn-helix domain-containing protein [Dietzia sp. ANT_WB102]KAA0918287.1 AraC family transcriptional regulator [Dietzia sp. ANT_WB102]
MASTTAAFPPGVRGMVEYAVTESAPAAVRPPHRGLPSSTLTLVFATDAPLLCSSTFDDWAERRGNSHDVCVGGFHLRPVYLERPDHQEGVQVAVHPLAARRVLGLPAAELTELTQEGEAVVGARMRALFSRVASAGPGERATLVTEGLAALIERNDGRDAARREVVAAWTLLERSRGRMSVTEVASRIGVSSRHLSSLVTAELGIGTKNLGDLLRFESAHSSLLAGLACGSAPRLADLAHAHGYADHAHLDQAYRRFTGTSPTRWIADEFPIVSLPTVRRISSETSKPPAAPERTLHL